MAHEHLVLHLGGTPHDPPLPLVSFLFFSGGDWKLGGMDLLAPLGGDDRSLQMRGALQPRAFRSPERSHDDWWRSTVSAAEVSRVRPSRFDGAATW